MAEHPAQVLRHPAARRPAAETIALAALIGGALCIALAPILVRLSEAGPTATAFWRFALAVPALWLLRAGAAPRGRAAAPIRRRDAALFALAGLFFAGDMGFWHWSIAHTSVANATLLANTAPVFVVLGGWLVFGLSFRPLFLLGLALALAGTAVLMRASLPLGAAHLLGDGLGIVAGAFYGAYLLVVERLRLRFSTTAILSVSVPVSALFVGLAALGTEERLIAVTWQGWAVLAALALVSQLAGQGAIAWALARLPVAFASVSLLVQPVAAALLAWALLAEPLGPVQAAGAAVVLAGILIARVVGAPKASA